MDTRRIEAYCSRPSVREALGIRGPMRAAFLAQGEYNINFTVEGEDTPGGPPRRVVFRLNTASQLQLENQIAYEYRALEGLVPSGVTPKPLWLDDTKQDFEYGLLCMEYLEGRPLDYSTDLHHAARLFATVHGMDVSDFEGTLIKEEGLCRARVQEGHRWLRDYLDCPRAPLAVKRILGGLAEACEKRSDADAFFERNPWRVVNNTEVNSHNFIIGDSGQYIIDWEKPVISDPVQDVTQFLAPTTTLWRSDYLFSDEEIQQFYALYDRYSPQGGRDLQERVALYKPFLYLRALSWCAHAWVAYQGERAISNPQTLGKIESYLEPGFMRRLLRGYL